MSCRFDQDLLQDYLEKNCDPLTEIFIVEHLKVCRSCRQELAELKALYWDLQELKTKDVAIPAELEKVKNEVLQKVGAAEETTEKVWPKVAKMSGLIWHTTTLFCDFIPGVKGSKSLLKMGLGKLQLK